MLPKALDQITRADLDALIGVAREGKTLEFKRELPDGNAGKRKLVSGVTALANTSGGDFVIGVVEKGGVVESIPGIQSADIDGYKLVVEQTLASQVEPRLPRVDVQEIDYGHGRWVLVIRVPRSWNGPHRALTDQHFYVRTSASTIQLGVAELRSAFGLREDGLSRIEAFRTDRVTKIMSGETPVKIQDGAAVVLHMAPLPAFADRELIDIVEMVASGTHFPLPLRGDGTSLQHSVNLLGVLNYVSYAGEGSKGYGQLFRSGAFEGLAMASADEAGSYLASIEFANMIVGATRRHIALQQSYEIAFPTFAMLSFCNAKGMKMRLPTDFGVGYYEGGPLADEVVSFPEILIEGPGIDVPTVLRPLLNIVWNAFGAPRCDMFTPQGAWKGTA